MKNKFVEVCFSFLALFLFACGLTAIVVLGMLMVPLLILALFVLVIKEIFVWKRKEKKMKQVKHYSTVTIQRKDTGIIRSMPSLINHRRAA